MTGAADISSSTPAEMAVDVGVLWKPVATVPRPAGITNAIKSRLGWGPAWWKLPGRNFHPAGDNPPLAPSPRPPSAALTPPGRTSPDYVCRHDKSDYNRPCHFLRPDTRPFGYCHHLEK
jgi:hypothetical protein